MIEKGRDGRASRRRHRNYLVFFVVALLALIWPGLALVSSPTPFVLGLPLSLAWIIAWLVLLFFGLVRLFISDIREGRDG